MEARLVRVAEPGATGHRQHLLVKGDRQIIIQFMIIWSEHNKISHVGLKAE